MMTEDPQLETRLLHYGSVLRDEARVSPNLHARIIERVSRAYEWAAAEELLSARRASFEQLRQGGVLGLDVEAGQLSPSLVERYLQLKERALL